MMRWAVRCLVTVAALAGAGMFSGHAVAAAKLATVVGSHGSLGTRPRAAPPTPAQELAGVAKPRPPVTPGPVLSKGPLVWAAPMSIDTQALDGLACPSISLCVAVDEAGQVVTSTDPVHGASTWRAVDVDGVNSLTDLACPSVSLCVAIDGNGNVVTSTDPANTAVPWSIAAVDTSIAEPSPYGGGPGLLRSISCLATTFCVAVDSVGNIVVSGNPAGGATAWTLVHVDDNSDYGCLTGGLTCQSPLMGVACTSLSLCDAVDFTGDILQTATPTVPAPWPSEPAAGGGPQSLWSVSCPTANFCSTVDGVGGDAITWNPADLPVLTRHRLPIDAFGIWCTTALCLASGEGPSGSAELVGSTDPAAPSATWDVTDVGDINAVSCLTPSLCLAVDGDGEVQAGVTVASLTTTLRQEALGETLPTRALLLRRGGETLRFTSPLTGRLQVTWQSPGAAATSPSIQLTTLATASTHFGGPAATAAAVAVKLTAAGRKLLKGTSRINLTATATYNTNTGAVSTQREFTLRGVPPRKRRTGRH